MPTASTMNWSKKPIDGNMQATEPPASSEMPMTVDPPATTAMLAMAETPASPRGNRRHRRKSGITVREMTIFSMLGAVLFCSKLLMEWAPNVHLIAMFIITLTLVYRVKALIPLYVFVFLTGIYAGFHIWWIPYLYIWLPVWGITMLLPRRMPKGLAVPLYMLVGGLHGLCYGTLYAPVQAFFYKMDWPMTLAWIVAGLPWDAVHGVGNAAACTLVLPLTALLLRLEKKIKTH